MAKVTDKIQAFQAENPGKSFCSLEFFPPKTELGIRNLYDRFDRMAQLNPLWIDLTWGAGGSTADATLDICINALQYHSLDVMMHLTCTNMPKEKLHSALTKCKAAGICNLLALRGDPPQGTEDWQACEDGFEYASDLVTYIRREFGDYFCIAVAGYPEGHLESTDLEKDIEHLRNKVDCGADMIVTQLFYDCDEFTNFVDRCRKAGIEVPIFPGLMPIQTYAGFMRMTQFCKTKVPQEIYDALEPIKDNEQAVKDYGVQLAVEMCRKLIDAGSAGIHFYTLNMETSVMRIHDLLGLGDAHTSTRPLPWRQATQTERQGENVRPIFWANRQKSYLQRTAAWDDFPNGRFGNRASPAFGEFVFVSMCGEAQGKQRAEARKLWGDATKVSEVCTVFEKFLDGQVRRLPWCDTAPSQETNFIAHQLRKMMRSGLLSINSQPRVNAALSNDPYVGWGPDNGFVYQKAYVEFFCSPEALAKLSAHMKTNKSISYTAMKADGTMDSNQPTDAVTAVTWGVFPGREVVQPTVADMLSFQAWKDEAFALWKEWELIYNPDEPGRATIETIRTSWYLVNVVDNNFVSGDLFGEIIAAVA